MVLSEFYAVVEDDTSAWIYWTTESEQNSYQWRLERAVDSLGPYSQRATLPAAGNSTMPTYYQYLDHRLDPDTLYYYRLAEVDLGGATTYFGPISIRTGVAGKPDDLPRNKVSLQAAPNPFNRFTIIRFQISGNGHVSLNIYNMAGQRVRTLVSAYKAAGSYLISWDGRNNEKNLVAEGIYLCSLISKYDLAVERIILLRK